MNPSGMFKILLALAPVLAVVFYLISMKQSEEDTKIDKAIAQHDVMFNKMAGEMEFDDTDKAFWSDSQSQANERLSNYEKLDHEKSAKNDATMLEMEKALNNIETEELK